MQEKKNQIPISLKVSYNQELELRISVPQQYYNRYCRHWLVLCDFSDEQQYHICKKYFSYLNQGDLLKIQCNNWKMGWKQKADRRSQTFKEIYDKIITNFQPVSKSKQGFHNRQMQAKLNNKRYLQYLQKIFQQDVKKQFSQLKVITIFVNKQCKNQLIVQILQKIKMQETRNIKFNIFVHEPLVYYRSQYNFIDQWVQINKISCMQEQIKNIFYKLSKITVKKITLNLKCIDGELFRKDLTFKKQKPSQWILSNNDLFLEMNFPLCNKIYIHLIQIRNMGYKQFYQFELEMSCVDIKDRVFVAKKVFALKPIRQQFQSIRSTDYFTENQQILKNLVQTNQSLNVDSIKYFDKLQGIKIICEKVQIEIKNNGKFQQSGNNQNENDLKMLHSFQI